MSSIQRVKTKSWEPKLTFSAAISADPLPTSGIAHSMQRQIVISGRNKRLFHPPYRIQTDSGAHQASYGMSTSSFGMNWQGREIDHFHLHPSSAEGKNG